jgi:hypothetical protein
MDPVVTTAEAVLRRSAEPALRLSELLAQVRAETGTRTLEVPRLRAALESHPDRFRLLDPWRGPWRFVREGDGSDARTEPWVVLIGDPGDQGSGDPAAPESVEDRLRASVRWLGATLDPTSPGTLARWHAMVLSERRTRPGLVRRAA